MVKISNSEDPDLWPPTTMEVCRVTSIMVSKPRIQEGNFVHSLPEKVGHKFYKSTTEQEFVSIQSGHQSK